MTILQVEEKFKAWAFPILIGIVIYFCNGILQEQKRIADTIIEIKIEMVKQNGRQDTFDSKINSLDRRVDNVEANEKALQANFNNFLTEQK